MAEHVIDGRVFYNEETPGSVMFTCERCDGGWFRSKGTFTYPVPCPNCDPCPVCKVRVADHDHDERNEA